ncbi:hypothetical protein GEMRC1_000877 [Eukaryota sp. GEM-RC1]
MSVNASMTLLFHQLVSSLETNTIPLVPKDFPLLSSIASLFGAELHSVYLQTNESFGDQDIHSCPHIVSALRINMDYLKDFNFLHQSSPFYLSHLKRLDLGIYSKLSFTSFSDFILNHSLLTELALEFTSLTSSQTSDLAKVFRTSNTLKTIRIFQHSYKLEDKQLRLLMKALSQNSLLKEFEFYSLVSLDSITAFVPIFRSKSIRTLIVPKASFVDSVVLSALKDNSSIREIAFSCTNFNSEDFADVLKYNSYLKRIEFSYCSIDFSPLFKSLETNNSLLEFILNDVSEPFNEVELHALAEMIKNNNTLLLLTISGSLFSFTHFNTILNAIESNSALKNVSFPDLELGPLLLVYEHVLLNRSHCLIDVYPHSIDLFNGCVNYDSTVLNRDLAALWTVVSLQVPIKRVECLGSRNLSLKGLVALFAILSVNNSLIEIDFSPHSIDIEGGTFCLSPPRLTPVSAVQVSFLKSILDQFDIKQFTIQRCQYPDDAISVLYDLIALGRYRLTSVDLSDLDHLVRAIKSESVTFKKNIK